MGARLRVVRKQMRLSLQAVEAMSDQEFKASVLGAYERGERAISVPRLQRLAKLYDVPVDQLLPHDDDDEDRWGGKDPETQRAAVNIRVGAALGRQREDHDRPAKLNSVSGPERDLLRRFLSMIQVQRQDFNGRMITIRAEDPAGDRVPVRGDPRRDEPPARRAGTPRNRLEPRTFRQHTPRVG